MMIKSMMIILLAMPGIAFSSTPTANQILASSKAAMGGRAWNEVHSIRIKATKRMLGRTGTSTTLVDLASSRTVSHAKMGAMTIASGFDGKSAWAAIGARGAAPVTSPARRRAAMTAAYRETYAWWDPKRWPAVIKVRGKKTRKDKEYWVLKITPKDGISFDLWINTKTGLIDRETSDLGVIKLATFMSDYRTVDGVKLPFHRRSITVVGGQKVMTISQVQSIDINIPVSTVDFAIPQKQ
jgi:hypothetical protein